MATPLHLGGVVLALSAVAFPLWQAPGLSWVGMVLGGALTFMLVRRVGRSALNARAAWPAWLRRLADTGERRRVPVGIIARLALGGGFAVEAFFVLTRYASGLYALVLVVGSALYVTQTILGVTLLHTLLQLAPGLAGVFALSPLLIGGAALLRGRRRAG